MSSHIWDSFGANPDESAEKFFSVFENRIFKVAFRLCNNAATAEDLASRTLVKAYFASAEYIDDASCFAWLCQILHNLYMSDVRRKSHKQLVFTDELPDVVSPESNPAQTAEDRSDAAALRRAIGKLSPLLRETIVLRYYEGLSIAEISRILQADEGAIKVRLYTAKQKLQQELSHANLLNNGSV